MKTQRLNLLEAMNFAMAGHDVVSYDKGHLIKLKKNYLAVYWFGMGKGIELTGKDICNFKDTQFTAGDDRSITGYYDKF